MPMFEYVCQDCKHGFEALVTGGKTPACPKCEGSHLEQQYSAFAVGAQRGKGKFPRSAPSGPCGSCGHPDGPGSCSN